MGKIFAIGANKTGTTSLTRAFGILGYRVCPENIIFESNSKYLLGFYRKKYDDLFKLVEMYDAFEDRPWNHIDFYKTLDQRYPDSKFILTIRDTDNWLKSYVRWNNKINLKSFWFYPIISEICYGNKDFLSDQILMKEKYEQRNAEVIDYFAKSDNFLLMDLEKNDGWEKLCLFLNKPIPNCPFPHENKTK